MTPPGQQAAADVAASAEIAARAAAMPVTDISLDPAFWSGRRVLLTGHTGFKGAWTALWLSCLGARVTGLSLRPEFTPNLSDLLGPLPGLDSRVLDLRHAAALHAAVVETDPELVIHMAAQALVPRSYREPVKTFAANVMGTAHLLEALRAAPATRAVLVMTSDKSYRNRDQGHPFQEQDPLGGDDPYSASKAATEMVVSAWGHAFLAPSGVAFATARAGNVVGGGDWSEDRLIPDLWRAAQAYTPVALRYPRATRPWQHVLEAIAGYLLYAQRLATEPPGALPTALNFGPEPTAPLSVADVAERVSTSLGSKTWVADPGAHPAEKLALQLDPTLARRTLGWRTRLDLRQTLDWTADWYRDFDAGCDMRTACRDQIAAYAALLAAPPMAGVAGLPTPGAA